MMLRSAGQNMTEGPVTAKCAKADLFIGQETLAREIRTGFPESRCITPSRTGLAIAWNPHKLHKRGKYELHRYHRSGKAEGWDFRTPARYALLQRFESRNGLPVTVIDTWWLNSWHTGPAGKDRFSAQRDQVIREMTMPVLNKIIREEFRAGQFIILEGDFNSITFKFKFPHMMEDTDGKGLDRLFHSKHPVAEDHGRLTTGPKTGRGPDRQHRSLHQAYRLHPA